MDTEKHPRKSWVVWGEGGKYPNVIVEILSPSTANIDRNKKKNLYQNTFRTPNYFWFDPESLELQGFRLIAGQYQAIAANENGYLWSEQLELYLGIFDRKLRYFTTDGQLVPTPQEAELEQRQAKEQIFLEKEQERKAKEQALLEKEQAILERERLAQKLRELGIDPETI
ncbi:gll0726 protein [Microcystis aeruginosa NIES-44]|uniref:Gll0726 protein n=1 Tax=Microcystis aeruginosa NIES-44 TaxID=449439 RepID=A0A0A1W048_MICAE|nr:gll0726 protein [Microcystis aeruginosa NIES-44]